MNIEIIKNHEISEYNGLYNFNLLSTIAGNLKCEVNFFIIKTNKIKLPIIYIFKKNKVILPPTIAYTFFTPNKFSLNKSMERHWNYLISELKKYIPKKGSFFLHPGFYDLRPFIWNNYSVDILYTYKTINKWDEENINKEERKQIKKAIKNKITIRNTINIDSILHLIIESYKRHKRKPPYKLDYIRNIISDGIKNKYITIRIAERENRVIAFRAMICGESEVYDWIAGSSNEGYEYGANSYLVYSLLKEESKKNKIVDMCGANTKSIAMFKSGFGLQLQAYTRVSW